mmetsp:Transcript_45207/g.81304  ORF Transcript_45207/g.81304 Transcript_45207/m.81304 type:complete len:398 (-) Transcript_45207:94-1287(-)
MQLSPSLPGITVIPQALPDEPLRASIAERFAGAYEAQLGHLTRQAEKERTVLQSNINLLRQEAYSAQQQAAEHRSQVLAARQNLGIRTAGNHALREAINTARAELQAEASAVAVSRAALTRDEQRLAEHRQRFAQESEELTCRCEAAQQWHRHEEQLASQCAEQILVAKFERDSEAQAAQEHQRKEQEALTMRERILRELRSNEEFARKTLREAIVTLEADFARERADFTHRDRQALSQIRELEQRLDQRHQALPENLPHVSTSSVQISQEASMPVSTASAGVQPSQKPPDQAMQASPSAPAQASPPFPALCSHPPSLLGFALHDHGQVWAGHCVVQPEAQLPSKAVTSGLPRSPPVDMSRSSCHSTVPLSMSPSLCHSWSPHSHSHAPSGLLPGKY